MGVGVAVGSGVGVGVGVDVGSGVGAAVVVAVVSSTLAAGVFVLQPAMIEAKKQTDNVTTNSFMILTSMISFLLNKGPIL